MRFKAAVLHRVGEPLAIETVEIDSLGPFDVLLRNHASGLCHTDLEVMQGSLAYPLPIILGHEGAGIVEAVGESVRTVRAGDHVVASWNPSCGHCFYCDRSQPILCEPFTRHQPAGHLLDGRSRLRLSGEKVHRQSDEKVSRLSGEKVSRLSGEKVHHFSVVSSHAQYSVIPEAGAVVIPREMPLDLACLIGCGVMTGVGAVCRVARLAAGDIAAIVGCGAVGLNAVQGARIQGASRIVAIDRDPARLAMAQKLGATDLLPADDATIDAVKALSAGRGADAVFECAGAEPALRLALEITRPGGDLVILGKTEVSRQVSLRFGSLMGEKRIVRSSYGGARPRRDFPWLASLYLKGELKLDELVTERLPLERINEGFDAMRRGQTVRTVLQLAA